VRAVAAVGVFVLVTLIVAGIGWFVFSLASPGVGGFTLGAVWAGCCAGLAWFGRGTDGWRLAGLAVAGFLVGPAVTAWLAWQASPKLLAAARHTR